MFAKDKYKPNLFNQDSDTDDDATAGTFGTNKEFAKNFNKLRSKELLKKHKNESDSSSSDDSDDSSDNDTINPKFDEAFYKALASIKKKDPKIYTDNVKFFDEFDAGTSETAGRSGQKAMTVVDYERKILLEKGGKYEDSDDDEADANGVDGGDRRPQSPTYNQEQQNLRDEFKKVIDDDEDSDNAEWGGIFKRRDKSKAEEAAEEEQYTKWLAGEEAANIGANAETLKPLKEYWANPKLAKEEAFLRDYILNNGYNKKATGQVPCYDDIVGNNADNNDEDEALSDDEAELEKQAEFEHKYNFRFEEPDAEFIKRYPRTIENSVRRTDDRRKEKRQEVKDRKTRDKEQKLRELEMLSAMKKREIEDKIAKLRMVTGNEELAFDDADLDGDFDPEEYDRKMQAVFNSEYYQVDEGDEKPECPAELEDLQVEDWDNYDPREQEGDDEGEEADGHCEDDDFNMDCEFDGAAAAEREKKAFQANLIESTRAGGKRKRKRKSKFMEVLQSKKPVFDPNDEKSFGDYLDEYYKLDYEDVIGDVPCRFKYTETVPNDFGLTVEEILLAKNKELNQWASLKKATQIRPEHVERQEIGLFKQKGKNEALKRKILQSLYEVPSDEEDAESTKTDDKSAKKAVNKKSQPVSVKTEDNFVVAETPENNDSEQPEKKVVKQKTTKQEKPPAPKVSVTEKPKTPSKPKAAAVKSKIPDGTKPNNKRPKPNTTPTPSPAPKKAKLDTTAVTKSAKQEKKKQPIPQQKKHNGANKNAKNMPPKNGPGKPISNKAATKSGSDAKISDERLRAFGINPKKFHNKQKYGPGAQQANKTNANAGKKQPNQNNGKNQQGNSAQKKRPIKKPDRAALERMKAKMCVTKKE